MLIWFWIFVVVFVVVFRLCALCSRGERGLGESNIYTQLKRLVVAAVLPCTGAAPTLPPTRGKIQRDNPMRDSAPILLSSPFPRPPVPSLSAASSLRLKRHLSTLITSTAPPPLPSPRLVFCRRANPTKPPTHTSRSRSFFSCPVLRRGDRSRPPRNGKKKARRSPSTPGCCGPQRRRHRHAHEKKTQVPHPRPLLPLKLHPARAGKSTKHGHGGRT